MKTCTSKYYGMDLHEYLNLLSPDCPIKLYDNDGNKMFDGYAGEVTESVMFLNFKVDSHAYDNEMIIWIY